MSNSGSYVSTSTRTALTIPVSAEESVAYDAIKSIVRKKKIREASALRAAKLKQERADNNNMKEREHSEKEARDAAVTRAADLRSQLNKLFLQQAELEKSVQYKWKEKVDEFEQRSLKEEEDALNKLRREQKQIMEKVRREHDNVEDKKFGAPSSEIRKGKRKVERQDVEDSRKKKPKVGDSASKGKRGNNQIGHDGTNETTTMKTRGVSIDEELFGEDDGGGTEKDILQSAKKVKDLEKIVGEMNYLNKTKSQMIWLLKQVITAEKKLPK